MKEPKSIMPHSNIYHLERTQDNLVRHEVFYGRNRQKSIKWGCVVYITPEQHNMSNEAVHFNKEFDLWLKQKCQEAFEELHGHKKFMEVFGRNYL